MNGTVYQELLSFLNQESLMERFRKYMDKEINPENLKDTERINCLGISCTYLPDPPEDFDEFEFSMDFNEQENIVITVAIESGKIKRVMFSVADKENPYEIRSLTPSQIEELLLNKGDQLVQFFEFITI
ncbi:hypothetical protein Desku_1503 [Desulfofundulus kuznetsovii DSM 6115]|uniref:Uncharacterized protein n=2 Tax=Desulfofundulus TaxID=2282741 RepID=A0AAU8PPS4_DESK7|nr:hypothetical protein Desku_1503 [Desulfofundulus kuznetsovii DSM 6115]